MVRCYWPVQGPLDHTTLHNPLVSRDISMYLYIYISTHILYPSGITYISLYPYIYPLSFGDNIYLSVSLCISLYLFVSIFWSLHPSISLYIPIPTFIRHTSSSSYMCFSLSNVKLGLSFRIPLFTPAARPSHFCWSLFVQARILVWTEKLQEFIFFSWRSANKSWFN